jgi:hypothetical protein
MFKQKSFQVNEKDWNVFFDIARNEKKSASEILRKLIHNFIIEKERKSLNLFLQKNCEYVSAEEELEITKKLKNKKEYKFVEVSADDLQD